MIKFKSDKKYFCIISEKKLEKNELKIIKNILKNTKEGNILLPKVAYINKKMKYINVFFFKRNKKYFYCFPIIKELNDEGIKDINEKLERKTNFKFQIATSSSEVRNNDEDKIDMISKSVYNLLLNDKINNGWRFGQNYSKKNKISPYIISWDNLKETKKAIFKRKIKNIIDLIKSFM